MVTPLKSDGRYQMSDKRQKLKYFLMFLLALSIYPIPYYPPSAIPYLFS